LTGTSVRDDAGDERVAAVQRDRGVDVHERVGPVQARGVDVVEAVGVLLGGDVHVAVPAAVVERELGLEEAVALAAALADLPHAEPGAPGEAATVRDHERRAVGIEADRRLRVMAVREREALALEMDVLAPHVRAGHVGAGAER
jgi:hypothetical protein